jgi:hypothetical protein
MEPMCKLDSITTNQAAIIELFRVINRYVGNLPPMPGYPAPVICNTDSGTELRWFAYAARDGYVERDIPVGEIETYPVVKEGMIARRAGSTSFGTLKASMRARSTSNVHKGWRWVVDIE